MPRLSLLPMLALVVTGGCSLVSLDALQELDGAGGSSASSAESGATAGTGASTSSASSGSGSPASSTSVGASSSAGPGPGSGGGGAGGAGPTGAYAAAVLADGPIAYLRLDEAAGETTAVDAVGSYDGTLVGGVTWGEAGAVADEGGASVRFDGASGALVLGDVLDFPNGAPFSIELWAKRVDAGPSIPALEWLFSKEVGFDETRQGYCLLLTDDLRLGAEVWFGDFDAAVAYKSSSTPAGAWHHLVVTGSTASLLVWVDGVAYDSGGFTAGLADTDGPLIFAAQAGVQNPFEGWLDEIAVYDVELTAAQIAAHLAAAQ